MKKLTITITIIFLSLFTQAQWQQIGPYKSDIRVLVNDGANIYSGCSGGLFLSANYGSTWSPVCTSYPFSNDAITALAKNGTNFFAATLNGGMFLSTNNGLSWIAINTGLPTFTSTEYITSIGSIGANIFVGTANSGVYLSTNNGISWSPVNTGLPSNTDVTSITVSGTTIYIGTFGFNGVFKSINNGNTWTAANSGLPILTYYITSLVTNGTNIFAGTSGGGVYLSSNNGNTWSPVNTGLTTIQYIQSIAISGSTIYATAGIDGIFKSTNNGTSWFSANTGLPINNFYPGPIIINGANVILGSGEGAFVSSSTGSSWTYSNTGMTTIDVYSFGLNGGDLYTGTYGRGAFITSNNGATWSDAGLPLCSYCYYMSFAIQGTNIFAASDGGVSLSTNNGSSWANVNTGLTNTDVRSLASSGTNIFAGTYGGGVFLSTNNGNSWSSVNSGMTTSNIFSLAINGANIFAGTDIGVFLTTNNGNTWISINSGLPNNTTVRSFNIVGSNIFIGTNSGIYKSTNNGNLWTLVNNGLPTNTTVYTFAQYGTTIFAGTNSGIYLSNNNGGLWTAVNNGLTATVVRSLMISGANIFAGTLGQAAWIRSISEMVSSCSPDITTGLVAQYDFSGNSNDLSGNNNNGTVNGATLVSDRFGNPNSAYSFNGSTSYIDIPNSASLAFSTNAISISFWAKINSVNSLGYNNIMISKQAGSGNSQQGFNVAENTNQTMTLLVSNGGGNFGGPSISSVPMSQWHHFVYVYNNGTSTSYYDGVQFANATGQTATIGSNTLDLLIGKANWSNINALYYSGILDDIKIYNRAVSLCDVDSLYNIANPCNAISANINSSGSLTFCQGGSVTLTANSSSSYLWSNNATTQSISVNTSGNYTVSVTNASGCSATSATISVTVNPLPTVSATATAGTINIGNPTTLIGGGASSYTWSNGVTNGVTFYPTATNTYTVTGTDANGCSNTATIYITVNPSISFCYNFTYQTAVDEYSPSAIRTADGGYAFLMDKTSSFDIVKTDSLGNIQWQQNYNIGTSGNMTKIIQTSDGGFAAIGTTNFSTYSSGFYSVGVVMKFSSIGSIQWTTSLHGTSYGDNYAGDIVQNSLGEYICTANIQHPADFTSSNYVQAIIKLSSTGSIVWNHSVSPLSGPNYGGITLLPSDSYLVTGNVNSEILLAKYDNSGSQTFINLFSYGSINIGFKAIQSTNGDIYIAGFSTLSSIERQTIIRCDASGNEISHIFHNTGRYQDMAFASDGNLVATGYIPANNNDMEITKFQLGNLSSIIWNKDYGGAQNDYSNSVKLMPNGDFLIGASTASIGNGGSDAWILRLDQNGDIRCACTGAIANISAAGSTTICQGNSVTLTANSGSSYLWSNNATTQSISVSTAGNYTVSVTNASSCSATSTAISITVNQLPTVMANATVTTVCSGNPTTLSGSGATSYSWTNGVSNGVSFNPSATNTYTVTGTDANGCSNSATSTITVNSLPTVSANATSTIVCSGSPTTLSGSGASSYTWTNGVSNAVAFNPTATNTYTVTGTDANGCSNMSTINVSVNQLPTVTANATSTNVCSGSPTTLSGSGASTYIWSNGVSNGVSFNPSATNTYTVTGTDANGCSNTSTKTVIVNSLPTVSANATTTNVCSGSPTTLTGNGASSYIWTNGVSNGVAFIPSGTNTYTVTGTDANGCSNSATSTITVNSLPTVSANATSTIVCSGSPTTLNGSGASSYTWSSGVINGISFNPTSTNTYTVTGTDASGCSNTATTTISVNQLPIITANATSSAVCSGNPTTLTGSGASSYTWTNGVSNGVSFNPTATNTYTVTGTDANGCSNTTTTSVTVNPSPIVTFVLPSSDDTTCNTNPDIVLSGVSPSGGVFSGTGVIAGVLFDPGTSGLGIFPVTYTYTNGNGCSASATQTIFVDVCSGIENSSQNEISMIIYPNPFSEQTTLSFGNEQKQTLIRIFDIYGKEVKFIEFSGKQVVIDKGQLTPGIYFVQIIDGNRNSSIKKIIIQ